MEESIKVNHLVEFKDKQVTDIDSKMQELNKSMEFEINFCFKEYIFDSLAQVLNQIKIDVIVSERESKNSFNYFNTPCDSISSTVCIPSIGTQPKPCVTTCSKGSKGGELNNPRGVAVDDSTSTIYVADYGNSRVQVFNYEGVFISNFT